MGSPFKTLKTQFWRCCSPVTDKAYSHHYEVAYAAAVLPHLDLLSPLNVLEIGVHNGGSLRLWEALFTHPDTRIYGIDIDPRCLALGGDRTVVYCGDQADGTFLAQVGGQTGPLDLVVDDGSHVESDYLATFDALWPIIRVGGVYVVEDMMVPDMARFSARVTPPAWTAVWPSAYPGRWIGMIGKVDFTAVDPP